MEIPPLEILRVCLWLLAGLIAFYFSVGNARIWTTIAAGFFLQFVSQAYLLAPLAGYPRIAAFHSVIGTIAILAITHGFQEYSVFSRTLEVSGSKKMVFLALAAAVAGSVILLVINPEPTPAVLRHIRLIENTNWVFLSLISLDLVLQIYLRVRGTPVARGFLAFMVVFGLAFLWRSAGLYLQVFGWDGGWQSAMATPPVASYALRVQVLGVLTHACSLLSAVSVGGTFIYLVRLLR